MTVMIGAHAPRFSWIQLLGSSCFSYCGPWTFPCCFAKRRGAAVYQFTVSRLLIKSFCGLLNRVGAASATSPMTNADSKDGPLPLGPSIGYDNSLG